MSSGFLVKELNTRYKLKFSYPSIFRLQYDGVNLWYLILSLFEPTVLKFEQI